ncbi:MAG: NAD(P)/FAD-dependent oxidoreductase [Oscillospiraceae bacterium]
MNMILNTPITVGELTLKNRIMFPPLTTGYEERDGSIGHQSRAFYTRLAKGGAAYIVLGDVCPIRTFSPTPKLFDDSQIESFRLLAESVHAYGAKIGVQIFHPEYDCDALNAMFAEGKMAEVRAKLHHDMEHFTDEVTEEALLKIIDKMCECAIRAEKAGIDVIQIHGDRLTGTLAGTRMNHRTDKFGGSLENRTRFARMLVQAIRKAVPNMVIDYKFAVVTEKRGKGGVDEADAVQFAKWLEEDGVDMLHVAQANHTGDLADTIPPMGVQPYGFFVDITARVKAAVNIPVSCVGRIISPDIAEAILESGKADIIAVGRPMLADPDFANKAANGKSDCIRQCVCCNKGCTDNIQNRSFLSCVLNAENGYEETRCIVKAEKPKRVVVIGGGMAGMEAARVAAVKGHTVSLYESAAKLGGQINIAMAPPRKAELKRATDFLVHEMSDKHVALHLGEKVSAEQILQNKPDAVIVAVGATSACPHITGADGANVLDAWQVLSGEKLAFGDVVIIGGGMVGCETAEYLAQQGCKISVVEMLDKIATGESTTVMPTLLEDFKQHSVRTFVSHTVQSITNNSVLCKDAEGKEIALPCNFVVMAIGAKAVPFDTALLEASGIEVLRIGDCADKPADISNAIRTAYDAANSL